MKDHISILGLAAMSFALMASPSKAALVAHYKLDETSGTTLGDSSGNGYDGTVVGGGDLNVAGTVGSAYEPIGSGTGYGSITNGTTNFGISGNNARTISFWFNTPTFGTTGLQQFRMIGSGGSDAAASFNIVAENGTNAGGANRIGLRYGNGNVYYDADNIGTAFATNTWYHVTVVYDGTTLDLESIGTASDATGLIFYVNGVEMNTAAGNLNNGTQALITASSNFAFGANADGTASNGYYPGLLDDVQVYDEALSSSEVLFLYNNAGSVIPELSSAVLKDFTYDATTGNAEVSIAGAPSTSYELVEADDLDFSNPDQTITLTGASPGTLAGDSLSVTTDGNGNATVQFNLGTTKSATFLRAETTP